ncbi:DUF4123 domain-containing protein [Pseudomonas sp. ENNP23]|uniref:DUF4123 domain-containing protein n=1 Tax=Pseudomonas sp. ENNP23 TaxID=1535636 RepID=UPI00084B9E1D|nr:DUF4123 domain-containing protein [Pseudomonas sp. ENNP23]OEC50117.1 hypothetical protein A9G05_24800 [Pseudomonas sp. ENNP23]
MSVSTTCLLLEFTDELPKRLYQHAEAPAVQRLFGATELAAYAEHSPLLVNVQSCPDVYGAFHQAPEQWPGLQLTTSHTAADLLQHLRRMLFVRFEGQRRGVLRYYSPRTASYFFPACAEERMHWLGPIQQLDWYGATWAEEADQVRRLYSLGNPAAAHWQQPPAGQAYILGPEHLQALQHQQAQRFLYHWWQQYPGVDYAHACVWIEEGRQLGFSSADGVTAFLNLRKAQLTRPLPQQLSSEDDSQRLSALERYWAAASNDKEHHS